MSHEAHASLQPSFVLHQRSYRETSLLVEAFSLQAGRVGLVARAARSPRSPLRGILQPFVPLLLSWRGGGDLFNLTGAEVADPAPPLRGRSLYAGLYLNELVVRLLQRHDPYPDLFETYATALAGLWREAPLEPVLRNFETGLLAALGYGLVLDVEGETAVRIDSGARYRYVAGRGPLRTQDAVAEVGEEISGQTLLALATGSAHDSRTLAESKRLMRYLINELLGGRELAARTLFERPRPPPATG